MKQIAPDRAIATADASERFANERSSNFKPVVHAQAEKTDLPEWLFALPAEEYHQNHK